MSFCAICTDDTADLERSEDGYLECKRCREEHPNYQGYAFDGGMSAADLLGTGNKRRSAHTPGVTYLRGKR